MRICLLLLSYVISSDVCARCPSAVWRSDLLSQFGLHITHLRLQTSHHLDARSVYKCIDSALLRAILLKCKPGVHGPSERQVTQATKPAKKPDALSRKHWIVRDGFILSVLKSGRYSTRLQIELHTILHACSPTQHTLEQEFELEWALIEVEPWHPFKGTYLFKFIVVRCTQLTRM